jgi:DNA (cytosine-5)-methyltransferase 1
MMRAVDMFAGAGGWSTGAAAAGVTVLEAYNHWQDAVDVHAMNHPHTRHFCQDLRRADYTRLPDFDLLLASPCCQGHSVARGKAHSNPQHDESRMTAWCVIDALEAKRVDQAIVENVPEFTQWVLYPVWVDALRRLGYSTSPHIVDVADLGVPQHRMRAFIVLTKSKSPVILDLPKVQHIGAHSFIDFSTGNWSKIEQPGRAQATLRRVANGRRQFGDRFIMPYYGSGSGLTGRDLARPIGTITTRARWALVDGDRMRMLTVPENCAAMSFPKDYKLPRAAKAAIHMLGNAVPPLAAQRVIEALRAAV